MSGDGPQDPPSIVRTSLGHSPLFHVHSMNKCSGFTLFNVGRSALLQWRFIFIFFQPYSPPPLERTLLFFYQPPLFILLIAPLHVPKIQFTHIKTDFWLLTFPASSSSFVLLTFLQRQTRCAHYDCNLQTDWNLAISRQSWLGVKQDYQPGTVLSLW